MRTRFRWSVPILLAAGCCLIAQDSAGPEEGAKPLYDEGVKPLHFESLDYPLVARLTRVQGIVVIRVALDDRGNVLSSQAISGPKSLISDCVSNSKKWRFQPNAEKAAVILYQFKIEGLCKLPCPSQTTFRPPNLVIIMIGDPIAQQ